MKKSSNLLLAACLCVAIILPGKGQTAITPVTVTPGNLQGWALANQRADATAAITTTKPRSGNGSLQFDILFTTVGQDKVDFQYAWNPVDFPTRQLLNLSALAYEYYRDSSLTTVAPHLHPVLRIGWYNDGGTPANLADDTQGLLIYEDIYQGIPAAPQDTWVQRTIDPATTHLWMYCTLCTGGGSGVVQNYNLTLNDWLAGQQSGLAGDPVPPDLSVGTTYVWSVNVGVGSGWNGDLRMFTDNIRLGFGPDDDHLFNFEPDMPAAPEIIPALSDSAIVLLCGLLLWGGLFFRKKLITG
jgi:hypothetical protein